MNDWWVYLCDLGSSNRKTDLKNEIYKRKKNWSGNFSCLCKNNDQMLLDNGGQQWSKAVIGDAIDAIA